MADTPGKLVFWRPADGSGKLVFGDQGGAVVIPDADFALDAAFAGDMAAHVGLAPAVGLGIDAGFADDMPASVAAAWDANAFRSTLARAAPHWQQGAPMAAAARPRWQASQPLSVGHRPHWQRAQRIAGTARPHWQASLPLRATARPAFQQGLPAAIGLRLGFQQSIALRATGRPAFQQGQPLAPGWQLGFQQTIKLANYVREHEQFAHPIQHAARAPLRAGRPMARNLRPHFQQGRFPPPGRTPIAIVTPPQHLCYDPARLGLLVFERAFAGDGKLVFVCRKAGGGPGPQPGGSIVVARRRSYIVLNSIEVRLAADGTLLPALDSGFSMRLDHRSWTWGFQLSLHATALPLLTPGPDGLPVELEVTVNGQPFRMLAESRRRSVQFPRAVLEVSGTGRAALLDAPYAAQQTFSQPGARTAQQLMLDVLTVNGVSMGWTLDWQLTDWPVPAGTWSHQGSWISAINDIAAAVGAYVQPHDTAQTLRILPRYPVRAWELASATPDITLPAGIATVEEVTWLHKPDYDAIYLQGEPGDKLYHRKRAGTPGTNPAPQAVHPLLVHADAAAQRAIAELSDTGRQLEQRLQLMVLPATGVIKPGTLLRYTDDAAVQRTGIVRATEVRQAGPRIDQTLTVQAHE